MKTYRVRVIYSGEEIYTVTSNSPEEAKKSALRSFMGMERGDIITHESTHEEPTEVIVTETSSQVHLASGVEPK